MQRPSVDISQFNNIYFLGIGGIGMSALARYFNSLGYHIGGYDKTTSELTQELENEGMAIHYEDLGPSLPSTFQDTSKTLVIITPAIPVNMGERLHVLHKGYTVLKRSEVLGIITRNSKAIGVAGTHGKTTTSTMLAHMLNQSSIKCSAFLGGISSNFDSNFITSPSAEITVIEADEFDRSFLQLDPFASIITTTDADHLDIYGDAAHFQEGFEKYAALINPKGWLIKHHSVELNHSNSITYGVNSNSNYDATNLRYENGVFLMDLKTPKGEWNSVVLGIPGIHNAENAVACIAMCLNLGIDEDTIRKGLASFKGVKRRFEYHIKTDELVYIDDYAHHPTEIHALISSVRLLYPNKRIIGVFQPHLFSRTRDFFDGFVQELSQLDEVILLPIYPAREEPIPGVTSDALLADITVSDKQVLDPQDALNYLSSTNRGVILTIGAGDIDRIVSPLKKLLA